MSTFATRGPAVQQRVRPVRAAAPDPAPQRESVPGLPRHDRCLVMGVVNVTPDSFSDGGSYDRAEQAIRHGRELFDTGADLLDIGGESTRPGARRVPEAEELRRVLPVVRELAAAGVPVSIDTTRSGVALAALDAGAVAVNDVSGGLADPRMAAGVARARVPFIAMHWRAPSAVMREHTHYDDIVADVVRELGQRLDRLVDAGIDLDRIVLDPGLGFAKEARHDWELLARLPELRAALGRPVLVGASRKSFLGAAIGTPGRTPPPRERDAATVAVTALAAAGGAYCVRVHDVAASRDAVRVAAAWTSASSPGPGA